MGNPSKPNADEATDRKAQEKKEYQRPKIISVEPLEIIAAVCNPPLGKHTPISCTIGASGQDSFHNLFFEHPCLFH